MHMHNKIWMINASRRSSSTWHLLKTGGKWFIVNKLETNILKTKACIAHIVIYAKFVFKYIYIFIMKLPLYIGGANRRGVGGASNYSY